MTNYWLSLQLALARFPRQAYWLALLIVTIASYGLNRFVNRTDSQVYLYFLQLFILNSFVFFLTTNQWPRIAITMLSFLTCLGLVFWIYLGLLLVSATG
jgi:hypothetical protein